MIDTYNYLGLFIMGFLSSTILPGGAEAIFYYLEVNGYDKWNVIGVATLGNSLGAIFSYYMGYIGSGFVLRQMARLGEKRKKLVDYSVERYGLYSALFTWLPFIGDFIAILLGIYKKNPLISTILITIGKGVRFIVLWELIRLGVLS